MDKEKISLCVMLYSFLYIIQANNKHNRLFDPLSLGSQQQGNYCDSTQIYEWNEVLWQKLFCYNKLCMSNMSLVGEHQKSRMSGLEPELSASEADVLPLTLHPCIDSTVCKCDKDTILLIHINYIDRFLYLMYMYTHSQKVTQKNRSSHCQYMSAYQIIYAYSKDS